MSDILLFTTPLVEGMPIKQYFGIVTANQVAGTGLFTDVIASFSDLFGGNSGAYRESMNGLYKNVTDRLKQQAAELGANAVVGVRIDYDNISAKNMSMFMVSIQGTAVKLSMSDDEVLVQADNTVSWESLSISYQKRKIAKIIEEQGRLSEDDWGFILKGCYPDLAESLYKYYQNCIGDQDINRLIEPGYGYRSGVPPYICNGIDNFLKYVSMLDYEDAIEYAYKNIIAFRKLIPQYKLFNAHKILELAKTGDLKTAIDLLKAEKLSYNDKDLAEMRELADYLLHLPETGHMEEIKGGLFSSGGLKYVCSCGEKNDPDYTYCKCCAKNKQGITLEQQNQINEYIELVDALAELL